MDSTIIFSTENYSGGKRRPGRPRKDTVAQHFTMPTALSVHIDAWAATQPDQPSRPEAIRRLVEKGLSGEKRGYHPVSDTDRNRSIAIRGE